MASPTSRHRYILFVIVLIFGVFLTVSCQLQGYSRRLSRAVKKGGGDMDEEELQSEGEDEKEGALQAGQVRREIMIIGDSLLTVPEMFFNLTKQLSQKICEGHPNFQCEMSWVMKGGMKVEELLAILPEKFNARVRNGRPLPDAVIMHCNSNILNHTQAAARQYESTLMQLLTWLSSEVPNVLIVTPHLFTPRGEIPNEWESDSQYSTVKVIQKEERACHHLKLVCVNMRKILQNRILERVNAGESPKDLSSMVGNKKEWVRQVAADKDELETIKTWDYQGSGGIFTFDGEHLNRRGTKIFVNTVAEEFRKWKDFWGSLQPTNPGIVSSLQSAPSASVEDSNAVVGKGEEDAMQDETESEIINPALKANKRLRAAETRMETRMEVEREIRKVKERKRAKEPNLYHNRMSLLQVKKLLKEDLRGGSTVLQEKEEDEKEEEKAMSSSGPFKVNEHKIEVPVPKKKKSLFGLF